MLKDTAADETLVEKSFTGMDTSPNETVAVEIARALMKRRVTSAIHAGQFASAPPWSEEGRCL
jgi:hypothetical protein